MAKNLISIDPRKGKSSFLNQGESGHINHTSGQDPYSKAVEQHKLDPIVFVSFHRFIVLNDCFVWFSFGCTFFKRVRQNMKLDKWVGERI